ncbi:MAG: alpha/beta hydrolase, partial [Chloroflexi bacterium]
FLTEVVAQPATLLASGLSCNYAAIVAKRFPETCTHLVLISPLALFGGEQAQNFWSKLMQQPVAGFLLYAILSTRSALRSKVARQHSPHQGQISESDVEYLYATTHQFGAEYAAMAELAGKLAVDASQQFEALRQPTLVIWGARALNNTNTQAITSQQNMPAQTEIALMPDAGTFVHEEYPALVIANILGWREEGKTATAQVKRPVVEKPAVEESGTSETEPETEEALMTYCVKCKKKTPMQDAQEVTTKNGNPAIKGKCSICGTGQFRMGRLSKETI